MLSKSTIDGEKQNRPTLIVRDLVARGVEAGQVYESLLRRGVFKWLSVRLDLIRLKNKWRVRVTESIERQKTLSGPKVNYERGYRKALEECREEIKQLCHSERWRVPDNDQKAQAWFGYYGDILKFRTDDNVKQEH